MDFDDLKQAVTAARFKNLGKEYDASTGRTLYKGWQDGVYEDYWSGPEKDFLGTKLAPVAHNYLYGQLFPLTFFEDQYRRLSEDKEYQKRIYEIFEDMDKKVKGHDDVQQFLEFIVHHGGDPGLLLVHSFRLRDLRESVYAMNLYFKNLAERLEAMNTWSYYAAPVLVASQLYGFGWKRTLALWALGALVSEGIGSQVRKTEPFSGWSVITYMIYGQMMNETFEDRKLRTLNGGLRSLRGLVVNGAGGYGAYITLSNLYYDPAPFLQKSQRTGVHHGAHHIGLLAGFLTNRWAR